MNLTIKLAVFCIFYTTCGILAQDRTVSDSIRVRTTSAAIKIDYLQPIAYGNNFVAKGYDLSSGTSIGLTYENLLSHLNLHMDVAVYRGKVVKPEVVGFFETTNFTRFSAGIGYGFTVNRKLKILSTLNFGYIKLKHTLLLRNPTRLNEKGRDDGVFLSLELDTTYSVFSWLDVKAGLTNFTDFLQIKVNGQRDSFFSTIHTLAPAIGIRIVFE
ncbi:hypothetical protein J8281_02230 [Aquimarina sp. U1-2]|uniref:hypothetical protein n=1 Tax=Aquimarina sp. U1-2 TaxID=2823141 RepID=UPI001AEC8EF9|nr:hypothetical protein [Aquimarina sp. U1-2]MBP2830992.1 hypothetical protein [Aquimarina sp. U1-2]